MKNALSLLAIFLLPFLAYAQSEEAPKTEARSYDFNVFLGIGRGTFETNREAPSKFPTLETRLGIGIIRPILNHLSLKIRPTLGIKFKRKSHITVPRFDPREHMVVDDMASQANRAFLEIPLLLQYHVQRIPLNFAAGINARTFFSSDRSWDYLSGKSEVGMMTGAYYRITPKLNIGLDYYYGLTRFFRGSVGNGTESYNLDIRNNFLQLSLEFDISR